MTGRSTTHISTHEHSITEIVTAEPAQSTRSTPSHVRGLSASWRTLGAGRLGRLRDEPGQGRRRRAGVGRVTPRRTGREAARTAGRGRAAAERYVDVGEVFLEALPVLEAVVSGRLRLGLRRRLALSHHQVGEVREQRVGRRGGADPARRRPAHAVQTVQAVHTAAVQERQHLAATQI